MSKTIVLTGGGSAGHVTPHLALIPQLQKEGYSVAYIGSKDGIEKDMMAEQQIDYTGVSTGKLRRYKDLNNLKDPFRVLKGITEARKALKKLKPSLVFSKGGFVSVPVVIAAKTLGIPCVLHESDRSPGLANKIVLRFCEKICVTFPETASLLPEGKAIHTGAIVRPDLFKGNAAKGRTLCDFSSSKPVLLVMGGSMGAQKINDTIRTELDVLLSTFHVIHICGKGKIDPNVQQYGYKAFDYVSSELSDLLACTDVVVSRAGSNAINEFLALRIPMLLVPLSPRVSRGDQVENAASFEKQGFASVVQEEELNSDTLHAQINELYTKREDIQERMKSADAYTDGTQVVAIFKDIISRKEK
ncbi:undecaprenyldiphospho-muramoylpentapeptide beta-N-acetylglucosaminyltransferase [Aureibacillus halotolerans]|uniref:UDP-N-acetylglucosamine--N-acetylmuramyl-(pentapeptide) pyrophosphoryl-undecaprenol N-acetylglucosamine transferase n=1 Tax=Aureibacillus halotolerans TaxID=1508390 RepID=A0A4R6U0E3_9BACI|nr:undecaprenyldiphospho-muramoylpentapeptide beta-N-acetylglucosaminyltransferase [Aureibacillus halotolerans]TDQ39778.1 UDP-N-acetylglucosamine-N-acetylmuramylpentapeptide N-acetylglucosamine transferase [Aureibacillus halotolerans]